MCKTDLILIFIISFLFTHLATAEGVNVSGKWELTISMPRGPGGERTREVEFIQDDESLTVIMTDREGNEIRSEGTIKGDEIKWSASRQTPRGDITITYSGKIIDENKMEGTVKFGDFGGGEWKAERAQLESQDEDPGS